MKTFAPPAGVRHKAGVAAVLGAVAALAAACGSQSAAGHGGTAGSGAPKPTSSLTISVVAARGATPRHWTLTCGPARDGGTHPHPAIACVTLTRARAPFAPVPRGVMCSMIYGGPQTAAISGTWHGRPVAATYSRENGCQVARWNKIAAVLGQINPGGINPGGPMVRASAGPPTF
jgi:Subtilisin inhibitor-like